MHKSIDFAEHFLGLLKNSGSSGSCGSRPGNALTNNDFVGTTDAQHREPVKSEWFSDVQFSGSHKIAQNQLHTVTRTTGTTRTTTFEQGPALDLSGKCPTEWYAILAELESRNPVEWLSDQRWCEVISDAEIFLTTWGTVAEQLGWTALDLFGVHPDAPATRFDKMGLAPLIHGGKVIALTVSSATIRRPSGAILTYRKSDQAGAVLLSEVRS